MGAELTVTVNFLGAVSGVTMFSDLATIYSVSIIYESYSAPATSVDRTAGECQRCMHKDRRRVGGACGLGVPVQGRVGNPQVSLQRTGLAPQGFPHLQQDPRASLRLALRILPLPSGQVTGPVVHQDTPAFEQLRAGIGRLHSVPDHMRQGRLDHLPGMVRLLFHCPASLYAVPTY